MSTGRSEAFSDGVIAVSSTTIGITWIDHHAMIGRLRRADHSILIRNLLLLMAIGGAYHAFPLASGRDPGGDP